MTLFPFMQKNMAAKKYRQSFLKDHFLKMLFHFFNRNPLLIR